MAELTGSELLHEWRRLMDSVVASAASVAGRADLPRQLLEQGQRQLELVKGQAELFERSVATLREPVKLLKTAAGPATRPRTGGRRRSS